MYLFFDEIHPFAVLLHTGMETPNENYDKRNKRFCLRISLTNHLLSEVFSSKKKKKISFYFIYFINRSFFFTQPCIRQPSHATTTTTTNETAKAPGYTGGGDGRTRDN